MYQECFTALHTRATLFIFHKNKKPHKTAGLLKVLNCTEFRYHTLTQRKWQWYCSHLTHISKITGINGNNTLKSKTK